MDVADFLRQFSVRSHNIMWLLGAGASAAAGVPTAYDMIWDFKRTLYCTQQKVPLRSCQDLVSPVVRARLQQYFDGQGKYPPEDVPEEYAYFFEATYPAEADRRRYIDDLVAGVEPSYGHLVLGALFHLDKVRIVWTTNFDRLIEDAGIKMLGSSSRLVSATLSEPQIALQAMNEGRWPLMVKLHGDFQSRRLKNTYGELQTQDSELRRALIEGCKRFGLAVIGYSGRDSTVMDALEEGIDDGNGFPFGLYWFHRGPSDPLPRVSQLIRKARETGIEAHLLPVGTFDELLGDMLLLEAELPEEVAKHLDERKLRVTNAPVPEPSRSYPILRFNALPILSAPSVCRRVVCKIGGVREVQDAVCDAGVAVLATRRQVGVLAFGSDSEVRKAFGAYGIKEFDLHSIEVKRLRYESAELGLLYESLAHAIARERPVQVKRKREHVLVIDPERDNARANCLARAAGALTGTVPGIQLHWHEAIRIRIEHRLGLLWLLLEPTIWIEESDDMEIIEAAKAFVGNRLAARYNRKWNDIVAAWAEILVGPGDQAELRTFGIGDGVDAAFIISKTTAFSGRRRVE